MPSANFDSPDAVDALFATFIAIYGTSKVRSMWDGAERRIVASIWSEQLAGYRLDAIEAGAREVASRCDERGRRIAWPPTLPEFLDLVEPHHREMLRRETDARALDRPRPAPPSDEELAEQLERIRAETRANLEWLAERGVVAPRHIRIVGDDEAA